MTTKNVISVYAFTMFAFCANVVVADTYPESRVSPTSKWDEMGNSPFNGTEQERCSELDLTSSECQQYLSARESGVATLVGDIPKGTVLDRVVFTDKVTGKHRHQDNVAATLSKAPTRSSRVYAVNGKAVIDFMGCNNPGLVRHWNPDKEVVVVGKPIWEDYEETTLHGGCPVGNDRLLKVSMLEEVARQNTCAKPFILSEDGKVKRPDGVAADVEYTGNGLDGPDLSRTCGTELNNTFNPGILNHGVAVYIKKDGKQVPVFKGAIRENVLTPAPEFAGTLVDGFVRISEGFPDDSVVEVRYDDYSKVVWPTAFRLRERLSSFTRGCEINRMTGIERVTPLSAPVASTAAPQQ